MSIEQEQPVVPCPADLPENPGDTFPRRAPRPPHHATSAGEAWVPEALVARGGFAEVWRARQVSLDRLVALKVLRPDAEEQAGASGGGSDPEANLLAEGLIAARLDHPNIVPVYDIVRGGDGRPSLAMKLVEGRPWSALLAAPVERPFEEHLDEHLGILQQVAQAVAFAHSRGVVHADLKPQQVVVGDFGEVFLMDWGLAVWIPAEGVAPSPWLPTPDTARAPAGTPAYMAPEQTLPSARGVGPWTDVYLLGGILHTILCGVPPHHAPSSAQAFYMAHRGRVVPVREAAPGRTIPAELESLAARSLDPDPARRPRSAAELLARVRDFRSGASRRREAEAAFGRAQRLFEQARDYAGYSYCLAELEFVRTHWDAHPGARALTDEVLRRYAEDALAHGDFVLARAQADRLSSAGADRLRERIAGQAEMRARRECQRRTFAISSACLLLGVGALLATLYVTQRRANEELRARQRRIEEARARAERARADAEGLLDYMLTDLRARLEPIGQTAVLDGVTLRAVGYYGALPESERTQPARTNEAAAHIHRAEVLRTLGRTEEARAAVGAAIAIARREPRITQTLAGALDRLGDIEGQVSEWEAAHAAFAECASLLLELPDSPAREIAVAHTKQAHALRELGRLAEARAAAREARTIRERIAAQAEPDDPLPLRDLLSVYGMCGRIEEMAGDTEAARRDFDAAFAVVERLRALEPDDWMVERDATVLAANIGDLLYGSGDHAGAAREYARALAASARMADHDPENADWAYIHCWNLKRACWAAEQLGDFDAALAYAEAARAHVCPWAAKEPPDSRFQHECALAHDSIGYDAHRLGRVDDALAAHAAAAIRWAELRGREPGRAAVPAAMNAFWHARALALAGRGDEARRIFEEGCAVAGLPDSPAARHLSARRPLVELHAGDPAAAAALLADLNAEGVLDATVFADPDFDAARASNDPAVARAVGLITGP